jgi:deazaflavin-dependent oxidoreductase (nitroreductase family)
VMGSRTVGQSVSRIGARLLRSRRFTRAPIWLYRVGLGFVFGSRLLMLEHVGRRTGRWRRVVLEVIGHPAPNTYLVVSGFGSRAQWFRNLLANPAVRVSVGGRRHAPGEAGPLPSTEARTALAGYARRYPRSWARLKPIVEQTLGAPIDDRVSDLPVVAIRLW